MKLKNCFIDQDGNIWRTKDLIEKSKDLPVSEYYIKEDILDQILMWQLSNVYDYCVHYKRVTNADLTKPIILRSDGFIMDGWHRVIKAIVNGINTIPSKRFMIDPEPDIKGD